MTRKKHELFAFIIFIVFLLIFLATASAILTPKRLNYGSTWGMFLKEEQNTIDVMFMGSSYMYCDIIPAIIWENSKYTSYVLAGPEQTIPMTYYYTKELFKTQSPSLIVIEVSSVFFPEYADYTKVNIGYMPLSANRIAAIFNTAEREEWVGLFFPLYNYHDRWEFLTSQDIAIGLNGYKQDKLAGYTYLSTCCDVKEPLERPLTFNKNNYNNNIHYLGKIAQYCQQRDCQIYFVINPSYHRFNSRYINMLEKDISSFNYGEFFDLNKVYNEIGIDSAADFYDIRHLNYNGAVVYSAYLGKKLSSDLAELKLKTSHNSSLWQSRLEFCRNLQ